MGFWHDDLVELLLGYAALELTGTLWLHGEGQENVCLLFRHGTPVWVATQLPSPLFLVRLAARSPDVLPLTTGTALELADYARKPMASFNSVLSLLVGICDLPRVREFLFLAARTSLLKLPLQARFSSFEMGLPAAVDGSFFRQLAPQNSAPLLRALCKKETQLLEDPRLGNGPAVLL